MAVDRAVSVSSDELPVCIIDGAKFNDFDGFCVEFSQSVLGGEYDWQGNLDALNDILRGGFGTPEGPWILRWCAAKRSRQVLGWEAIAVWLRERLKTCHPSNVPSFRQRLSLAERSEGETLFDLIVTIIRDQGIGGSEAEDGVVLVFDDASREEIHAQR